VYDQAWKQYSPGSILTRYLMEHVIDRDQVEVIDFLTGNDSYKQDWMSERRERWQLYCAKPRPPKGRAERFADAMKARIKRVGKRLSSSDTLTQ
jgi:CelD/BcsL family acetyltransferase involved in cellulose biosynthesis